MGLIRKTYSSGFTLVEVLVVILIVSFVLGLSGFYLKKKAMVNSQASEMASYLRYVRSEAIRKGEPVIFSIDVKNRTYKSSNDSESMMLGDEIDLKVILDTDFVNQSVADLVFYPDGSSSGMKIKMSDKSRYVYLDVSWITGIVQLRREYATDEM